MRRPRYERCPASITEAGHPPYPASGRPPEGVYPIARQLRLQQFGGYIVAFNGSKVIEYKTKRCLYEQYLSKETLRSLWYDARCYGLGIMTYGKGKIITRLSRTLCPG